MQWFDVDKPGLAKLLERKGKQFVLYELVQNAWDEETSRVTIKLERMRNSPYVALTVGDDNPGGFADLTHAFTLFAESNKKGNAQKRGRFNLGEKLVLALCRKAEIASTTGTIVFDENGRRRLKASRSSGSQFYGELKMTDAEIAECREAMNLLIAPDHIETFHMIGNDKGESLPLKRAIKEFEAQLPTEIADADGNMRRTTRKTKITIHRANNEQAWLYEMGIPVVQIDGRYHVNVHQKVPLNFDRDNVSPSYLSLIHALAVEQMRDDLTTADVNESWVKVAIQERGDELSDATARKIADLRFGEKRVAYDPSDPEANNIAVSKGYQVIHGGTMSGKEWGLMRRAEAILPAGKVTPSQPDATVPRVTIPESQWTAHMHAVAGFCREIAPDLIGVPVKVLIYNNPTVSDIATYGSRIISFNMGRLGRKWFEGPLAKILELIIHEFAHEVAGNHLSEEYYDALTEIGAKMSVIALNNRFIFDRILNAKAYATGEADA